MLTHTFSLGHSVTVRTQYLPPGCFLPSAKISYKPAEGAAFPTAIKSVDLLVRIRATLISVWCGYSKLCPGFYRFVRGFIVLSQEKHLKSKRIRESIISYLTTFQMIFYS